MEIVHEVMDIEDLFIKGKDNKVQIILTIEGKGDFKAYVSPVTYGQIKNIENTTDEVAIASYVLSNHFFKGNGEAFTKKELDYLPAGVLKAVVSTIMDISGLNISDEDIRVF